MLLASLMFLTSHEIKTTEILHVHKHYKRFISSILPLNLMLCCLPHHVSRQLMVINERIKKNITKFPVHCTVDLWGEISLLVLKF